MRRALGLIQQAQDSKSNAKSLRRALSHAHVHDDQTHPISQVSKSSRSSDYLSMLSSSLRSLARFWSSSSSYATFRSVRLQPSSWRFRMCHHQHQRVWYMNDFSWKVRLRGVSSKHCVSTCFFPFYFLISFKRELFVLSICCFNTSTHDISDLQVVARAFLYAIPNVCVPGKSSSWKQICCHCTIVFGQLCSSIAPYRYWLQVWFGTEESVLDIVPPKELSQWQEDIAACMLDSHNQT